MAVKLVIYSAGAEVFEIDVSKLEGKEKDAYLEYVNSICRAVRNEAGIDFVATDPQKSEEIVEDEIYDIPIGKVKELLAGAVVNLVVLSSKES